MKNFICISGMMKHQGQQHLEIFVCYVYGIIWSRGGNRPDDRTAAVADEACSCPVKYEKTLRMRWRLSSNFKKMTVNSRVPNIYTHTLLKIHKTQGAGEDARNVRRRIRKV